MPDLENAMQTIKRVGQPDDIANAVAFLGSELPGFISGEVVHVSGGRFGRVKPRLSIRDFHADLRETGSPAWAHKPSNQCRRWRATAKRSVGMSGVTLGFSQNAPTASTL